MTPPHLDETPPSAKLPLLVFAVVVVQVFLVMGVTLSYPHKLPAHPDVGNTWDAFDSPWLDGYARWDGGWYKTIAVRGYYLWDDPYTDQTPIPFFPLYGLLMRAVGQLGPDAPEGDHVHSGAAVIAGIVITLIAARVLIIIYTRWCAVWLGAEVARTAALTLVCYPLVYYLAGLVYSEALFIALALGAFYSLERDRFWLALLLGAAATATRPVGFGVFVGVFVRQLERSGVLARRSPRHLIPRLDLGAWRWKDALLLGTAAGALSYVGYLGYAFGSPELPWYKVYPMSGAAEGWYMEPGPKVWFKIEAIRQLTSWPWGLKQLLILFHGGMTLAAICLLPAVIRRFGWGYCAYALVVLGMPIVASKDFIAMGRYLLPAFPCLAMAGAWLHDRPPRLRLAVWAGGLVSMCWFASRFVRWYYVS